MKRLRDPIEGAAARFALVLMRRSPSIIPGGEPTVYLVMDDLGGRLGRIWREVEAEATDDETLIRDLLGGQYCNPRVIPFNTTEGWSRDVSAEIAKEKCERLAFAVL
jgi:hypothetical protein